MVHNFTKPLPITKNVVCWNQHEKFCLLVEFEETLRWRFDWLGQLTWNDPLKQNRVKFAKGENHVMLCHMSRCLHSYHCNLTVNSLAAGLRDIRTWISV